MDASSIAMSVVSICHIQTSPTPFLLCHTIPTNKAFLLGTSLLFIPFWSLLSPSLPSPIPKCFPSPCLSMMQEKRERELWKHSTHTHQYKKSKTPHILLLAKLIDALHLRAKVAAAISWDQLHICKQASKQASKQARRWDREVPDILELIAHYPDWVSPPHLQCEFVCLFFFPWRLRQEDFFLLMGEMGFLGLVGARQHSWNSILSFVGHSLIGLEAKRGKKRRFFWRLFCFFFCHITFWAWAKVYLYIWVLDITVGER